MICTIQLFRASISPICLFSMLCCSSVFQLFCARHCVFNYKCGLLLYEGNFFPLLTFIVRDKLPSRTKSTKHWLVGLFPGAAVTKTTNKTMKGRAI